MLKLPTKDEENFASILAYSMSLDVILVGTIGQTLSMSTPKCLVYGQRATTEYPPII